MSPSTQQNSCLLTRQPSSAATLSTQTVLTGFWTHNSHLTSCAREHHWYQVFLRPLSAGRKILWPHFQIVEPSSRRLAGDIDNNKLGKTPLLFRNGQRSGGTSPGKTVFNKPLRDCLPANRSSFAAEWQKSADVFGKRTKQSKALAVEHFNKKAHP